MKQYIMPFLVGVALVACMLATFQIGKGRGYSAGYDDALRLPSKSDTLGIRDTLRELGPFYVTARIERPQLFEATDTVRGNDTLFVALPREVQAYEGEGYRAQVSGVDSSLDWINVYLQTKIITQTTEAPGPQRWRRVGFGVAAGPGIVWDGKSVKPGAAVVIGFRVNF